MESARENLARLLHVLVVTDRVLAGPRGVEAVVQAALSGGCRSVQLRDKTASARELAVMGRRLLELTRPAGSLFFVNDRLDVALAIGADGVHLGPADLPVGAARAMAPPEFLIGYSTDDPECARAAEAAGASYLGCGSVFRTSTKDVGAEAIGTARLDEVARSVGIPVVGIGGVDRLGAEQIAGTGAVGVAVVGSVMRAEDPAAEISALMAPFLARENPT